MLGIQKLNIYLDLIIKIFTILFSIFLFIGTLIIWSYLSKFNLEKEISVIIVSPQVLLTIAVYTVSLSLSIISAVLCVPAILDYCEKSNDIQWAIPLNSDKFLLHFLIILAPLIFFILTSLKGIKGGYLLLLYSSLILLFTSIFYSKCGGPAENKKKNILNNLFYLYVYITTLYAFLLFSLFFIIKTVEYVNINPTLQWIILTLIIIVYSVIVAVASSSNKLLFYLPIFILSLFIIIIFFADKGSIIVISRLGVGSYSTSFSIESKNIVSINNKFKIQETNNKDIQILKNIWIVLKLPDTYIISTKEDSGSTFTIPRSAVINEINE